MQRTKTTLINCIIKIVFVNKTLIRYDRRKEYRGGSKAKTDRIKMSTSGASNLGHPGACPSPGKFGKKTPKKCMQMNVTNLPLFSSGLGPEMAIKHILRRG